MRYAVAILSACAAIAFVCFTIASVAGNTATIPAGTVAATDNLSGQEGQQPLSCKRSRQRGSERVGRVLVAPKRQAPGARNNCESLSGRISR